MDCYFVLRSIFLSKIVSGQALEVTSPERRRNEWMSEQRITYIATASDIRRKGLAPNYNNNSKLSRMTDIYCNGYSVFLIMLS